jgi:transcriptional regulator with XRE-family HTH domain
VRKRDRAPLHRRRLGRALKRLREQARLTQEEAGAPLRYSDSKISRIESGQLPDYAVLITLLDFYGLISDQHGPYVELWELACQPGWWNAYKLDDQGYVSMEHEATTVREFQPSFVPGLLQTEAYARELFAISLMPRSRTTIENQIAVRMRRQERLTVDDPLRYEAIIQEGVLRRPDADSAVQRGQLRRIIERAELPNVTVRVLPESAGKHDGLTGPVTLLRFPDTEDIDVAYVEHALGSVHIEDPEQVRAATLRLDHVARLALSPTESIEFIEQVVAAL